MLADENCDADEFERIARAWLSYADVTVMAGDVDDPAAAAAAAAAAAEAAPLVEVALTSRENADERTEAGRLVLLPLPRLDMLRRRPVPCKKKGNNNQ